MRRLKTTPKVKMRRCFCFLTLMICLTAWPQGRESGFISLSPSITEIMFAVGAGDLIAGVSAPADYPPEASGKTVVASYDGILFEKISALRPEGCLTVSGMQSRDSLDVIRRLGIGVAEYPVGTIDELYACIIDVGKKCGREKESAALVSRLKNEIRNVCKRLPSSTEKALFLVGLDPAVAVGKGSYLNDLCRAAGFRNVLEEVPPSYSVVSFDTIASRAPDWIIVPEGEIKKETVEAFVRKVRMFNKDVKIGEVPADLVMRPGPRVAEGVASLAALRKEKGK